MAERRAVDGACRVILMGMMGSGKTTIGRLLSARTAWPYHDNDELVARSAGGTARELLADLGERAMRAAERQALQQVASLPAPCIAGVAAGTILEPLNRRLLAASGIVVWLHAPATVLAERAKGAAHRPWLVGDVDAWFERALAEREPLYRAVADVIVDARPSPAEIVARLITELNSLDVCPPVA